MTITKNTYFMNNTEMINNIPNTCEFLIINCKITKHLDNLPIPLRGIYFLNNCYEFTNQTENVNYTENQTITIRDGSYYNLLDNALLNYQSQFIPTCSFVYTFSLFPEKIQIKVKTPFGCKVYNNKMEEIENFNGYVTVIK